MGDVMRSKNREGKLGDLAEAFKAVVLQVGASVSFLKFPRIEVPSMENVITMHVFESSVLETVDENYRIGRAWALSIFTKAEVCPSQAKLAILKYALTGEFRLELLKEC